MSGIPWRASLKCRFPGTVSEPLDCDLQRRGWETLICKPAARAGRRSVALIHGLILRPLGEP